MIRRWFAALVVVLVVSGHTTALSQEHTTKNRPRIGLALSGGGARGFAHIGVLEWFEEHHIPVDYIAGTSMGGLVGGLYAMGMTPTEMREVIGNIDWNDVLRGAPAFEQLSFRRKEDRRSFQNSIELGLKNGLTTSAGLNPGHQISLILDRLTLPYSDIKSFDELPIPLRVVATDMLEAKPVVLTDGSLSEALRATMAFPGLFTPVERGDTVLADGGLVNNIPTDIVKQMGADIVIAVNVGTPLADRKALDSLLGILQQSIAVMTIENDRRNLKLADITLSPDLGQYSLLDFPSVSAIADLGYQGAEQSANALQALALDPAAWQQLLAERQSQKRSKMPVPTSLEIAGVSSKGAHDIREKLDKFIGRPLAPDQLEAELTGITGEGRYESLGYEIERDASHKQLLVRAKKKSYGPPFLNLSLEVQGSDASDIDTTIGGRLTMFDIGAYGSEWRTDVRLGSRTLLSTEYYRPLGENGWFIAPRAAYDKGTTDLYLSGSRVAEYQTKRAGAGLDFGYTFRRSELRFGYDIGNVNAQVEVGDPLLPSLNGKVSDASVRWSFDGQDNAIVPTRGLRLSTQARWFFDSPGAGGDFPQAEVNLSAFKPVTKRGSIFVIGGGGTTFNKVAPPAQQFTLGGPFRLGAFGRDEFRASHYLLSGVGYLHQIFDLPPLLGEKIYAGGWHEFGGAFEDLESARFFNSISGGVIMVTRLGPVSFGGSLGEGGRTKLYFSIGRVF